MIVNELPTENIKNNKIYCVRDTISTDGNNTYIEYAYINNAWEKVGEFQAKPDLRGYAKLDDNVSFARIEATARSGYSLNVRGHSYITDLKVDSLISLNDQDDNRVFTTNGKHASIGTKEDFTFTLEDGSTVTKSIRVLSTTTNQAEA